MFTGGELRKEPWPFASAPNTKPG